MLPGLGGSTSVAARGEFQLNAARRTLRAIKGSELVFVHYIHVSIDEPEGSYEQLNIARGGTDQGGIGKP